MLRARAAALALILALGSIGGCLSFSDHPWFGRHFGCATDAGCCDAGCPAVSEGPVLGDCPAPAPVCQNPMPPLTAPPRLVPQPQSQPMPYTPPR